MTKIWTLNQTSNWKSKLSSCKVCRRGICHRKVRWILHGIGGVFLLCSPGVWANVTGTDAQNFVPTTSGLDFIFLFFVSVGAGGGQYGSEGAEDCAGGSPEGEF